MEITFSMLEMLAGIAFLITDVLTLMSVLGSTIILLGTVIAAVRSRRFRAPEQVFMWSVGGLLFGTAGTLILAFSSEFPPGPSVLLGYSRATISELLLLSFILLVASRTLAAKITRSRNNIGTGKAARRNPF
jgi:hypothetical protein